MSQLLLKIVIVLYPNYPHGKYTFKTSHFKATINDSKVKPKGQTTTRNQNTGLAHTVTQRSINTRTDMNVSLQLYF